MKHIFDTKIAEKYGIKEAIIIENMMYWIDRNKKNEKNLHDDRTWIYNSVEAWHKLFPYLSQKSIRNTLDKLIKTGIIMKGRYNKSKYDQTNWYAFVDEERWLNDDKNGKSSCPKGQIKLTKRANQIDQKGKPIPIVNTIYNNTSVPSKKNCSEQSTTSSSNCLEKESNANVDKNGEHYSEDLKITTKINRNGNFDKYMERVKEWFKNIPSDTWKEFEKDYKNIKIRTEMNKAFLWLKRNPQKRKTLIYKFVTGWLNRAQNRVEYRKEIAR